MKNVILKCEFEENLSTKEALDTNSEPFFSVIGEKRVKSADRLCLCYSAQPDELAHSTVMKIQ